MQYEGEYDHIIVGAGCVPVNRLTADPSNRVLVLKTGGKDRNRGSISPPASTATPTAQDHPAARDTAADRTRPPPSALATQ